MIGDELAKLERGRPATDNRTIVPFNESQKVVAKSLDVSAKSLQRAMITDELAKLERGGDAGVTKSNASIEALKQDEAAKLMGVSRSTAQRARAVSKADPALAQKVKAGEVTLNAAHKQVAPRGGTVRRQRHSAGMWAGQS